MALPRKLMRATLPARRARVKRPGGRGGGWDTLSAMPTPARRTWTAIVRLLERDERVFAFLLAVVMVGGLATLGLAPLRPRYQFDVFSLVQWFAFYKAGILAFVTIKPRATTLILSAALEIG